MTAIEECNRISWDIIHEWERECHRNVTRELPSGHQTWLAGKWTTEISDFPSLKPPLIGDCSLP